MPYISASIVVQLFGIVIPYFQRLQKEGESGRKKVNQITRYLTILITAGQAIGYVRTQIPQEAITISMGLFTISSLFVLTTGTMFVMWLGERITDKGLGNGTSLIIMIGILGLATDQILAFLGKRLFPWETQRPSRLRTFVSRLFAGRDVLLFPEKPAVATPEARS